MPSVPAARGPIAVQPHERLIAIPGLNSVAIAATDFSAVETITLPSSCLGVEWQPRGEGLLVLMPQAAWVLENGGMAGWQRAHTLKLGGLKSGCWQGSQHIALATEDTIALWSRSEQGTWGLNHSFESVGAPVYTMVGCASGRFLATASQECCLPKVWHRVEGEQALCTGAAPGEHHIADEHHYASCFLPHPRAVQSLEWRPDPGACSVLATTSLDGVVRLWRHTGQGWGTCFRVCTLLCQLPVAAIAWVSPFRPPPPEASAAPPQPPSALAAVSVPTGSACEASVDWVTAGLLDGSVQLYRVKGLASTPVMSPSVALRVHSSVLPLAVGMHTLHATALLPLPTAHGAAPPSLSLQWSTHGGQTGRAALRCEAAWTEQRRAAVLGCALEAGELAGGHQAAVQRVLACPADSARLCSLDAQGQLLLWRNTGSGVACEGAVAAVAAACWADNGRLWLLLQQGCLAQAVGQRVVQCTGGLQTSKPLLLQLPLSPTEALLVAAGASDQLHLCKAAQPSTDGEAPALGAPWTAGTYPSSPVCSIAAAGSQLAVGTADGAVSLWRWFRGRLAQMVSMEGMLPGPAMELWVHGEHWAAGHSSGAVSVFRLQPDQADPDEPPPILHTTKGTAPPTACWTPPSVLGSPGLAASSGPSQLALLSGTAPVAELAAPAAVSCVAWSQDSLVLGTSDGSVVLLPPGPHPGGPHLGTISAAQQLSRTTAAEFDGALLLEHALGGHWTHVSSVLRELRESIEELDLQGSTSCAHPATLVAPRASVTPEPHQSAADLFSSAAPEVWRQAEAGALSELLKSFQLPCSVDRAMLDTVSHTVAAVAPEREQLDRLGTMYRTMAQQLLRDPKGELPWAAVACGLHSESQSVLLEWCKALPEPSWSSLRRFKLAMFVESPGALKELANKVAVKSFQSSQDPADCSLLFVVLGKARPLASLYRTKKNPRMADFFSKDFGDPAAQVVAKKNAFVLLSKHNYEMAATVFALAGMHKEAIDCIAGQLKDLELAVLIARIIDGDAHTRPLMSHLFSSYALPLANRSRDGCLASVVHWWLGERREAAAALCDQGYTTAPLVRVLLERLHERLPELGELDTETLDETAAQHYCTAGFTTLALQHTPQDQTQRRLELAAELFTQHLLALDSTPRLHEQAAQASEALEAVCAVAAVQAAEVLSLVLLAPQVCCCPWRACVAQLCLGGTQAAVHELLAQLQRLSSEVGSDPCLSPFRPHAAQLAQLPALAQCALALLGTEQATTQLPSSELVAELLFLLYCGACWCRAWATVLLVLSPSGPLHPAQQPEGWSQWRVLLKSLLEAAEELAAEGPVTDHSENMQQPQQAAVLSAAHNQLLRWLPDACAATQAKLSGWAEAATCVLLSSPPLPKIAEAAAARFDPFGSLPTSELLEEDSTSLAALWPHVAEGAEGLLAQAVCCVDQECEWAEHQPAELFRLKGELLASLAVSSTEPRLLAVATAAGVYEVSLQESIARERSSDRLTLAREELGSWQDALKVSRAACEPPESPEGGASLVVPLTLRRAQSSSVFTDWAAGLASPAEDQPVHRGAPLAHSLSAHPSSPLYLAGSDSGCCLWRWGSEPVMAAYSSEQPVNKVLFNCLGDRFGSCSDSSVLLWRMDPSAVSLHPYESLNTGNKTTADFSFLSLGSCVVTAGVAADRGEVCVWDLMVPPSQSLAMCFGVHDVQSVAFSARHNMILAGTKKGTISALDIRMTGGGVVSTLGSMGSAVRTIAVGPDDSTVVCGTVGGELSRFSLASMQQVHSWGVLHEKRSFLRNKLRAQHSSFGVTGCCVTEGAVFTCGADGTVKMSWRYGLP